jgi:hypothetical protein
MQCVVHVPGTSLCMQTPVTDDIELFLGARCKVVTNEINRKLATCDLRCVRRGKMLFTQNQQQNRLWKTDGWRRYIDCCG